MTTAKQSTVPDETLRVRVQQVNSLPDDLFAAVPEPGSLSCWIGENIEIVGWGSAWTTEIDDSRPIRQAGSEWKALIEHTDCKVWDLDGNHAGDDSPSFPFALASFGFAPSTPSVLIVPRFTLVREQVADGAARCWVVAATTDDDVPDPLVALEQKSAPLTVPVGLWTDPGKMTQNGWRDAVRRLIVMLRSGAASKVVLTRDIIVSASTPIDERYLLGRLRSLYPTTWVYAVSGLIGATPEMLASLKNGHFRSRVLAGSSAPGRGEELMASMKNRTEHHLAVESVSRAVGSLAESMNVPRDPELLDLPNVTHLSTEVTATVTDADLMEVVEALHPTAAVCGTPTQLAFEILEGIEGTQRGRYSGPVGWIDARGDGEFGIALRCGQLLSDRTQIRVFAGGGIMPDSNPDMELAETRAKMRPLLEALNVEAKPAHAG